MFNEKNKINGRNSRDFSTFAFPLIRATYPGSITSSIVGVQPMSGPPLFNYQFLHPDILSEDAIILFTYLFGKFQGFEIHETSCAFVSDGQFFLIRMFGAVMEINGTRIDLNNPNSLEQIQDVLDRQDLTSDKN